MKKSLVLLVLLLFSATFFTGAQECKVLVKNLEGSYTGDCKKGLAQGKGMAQGVDRYEGSFKKGYPQGKGTYTWSTGEVYTGEWNMGLRDGYGKYMFRSNNRDTVLDGMWKNDKYIGPKPIPPKITQKQNIISANFRRVGDGDKLSITFSQAGAVRTDMIDDLSVSGSSGSPYNSGNIFMYQNISFPFTCRITYKGWNKLKTVQFDCILEFTIAQPGTWELKVEN